MKKCIFAALLLLCTVNNSICAQNYVKNGTTFKSVSSSSRTSKSDTLITKYTWEDSKGNQYPIIINKGSGACYVWKVSQKSGKPYKNYMQKEISAQISKELGIEYNPKSSSKKEK